MQPLNSIVLEGNLVQDPEVRTTPSGSEVCLFTVANNYWYKQGDDFVQKVYYFDVEAWSSTAKYCRENLKKGYGVRVAGALRQDRWNDKEGNPRSKVKIKGEHVEYRKPQSEKAQKKSAELVDEVPTF